MQKVLVANRGEIALRIMRSLRELGIKSVAVYSEADRDAPHVQFADEAYLIGPAPAAESYLLGHRIIETAVQAGVDGIHPGYGFLSENAGFAAAVAAAGITFIGPRAEVIELMGNKLAAKRAAKAYGVPLVPGLDEAISDAAAAEQKATEIGYPVLIKAAAGGGGKGMRVVENAAEFKEQMTLAQSEALKAFGDGSVFLERYIAAPRHIEIQVMADHHGNICYLMERECSIQRRHQKVIEEAPSATLSPELRKQMGEAAVNVCRACGYTNAGTVEFLVDEKLNFYFLEMNTRLQVEHPVTEMILGLDLVAEQINVARGGVLSFRQEELQIKGHAIEIRVYAEDPANNFLPDIGTLALYHPPTGRGVRLDSGFKEGMLVPIYYDPMLAKLIVHAESRAAAIEKMITAIDDFDIVGVETTLPFCRFVLTHPAFVSGAFDTNFVGKYFKPELLERPLQAEEEAAALAFAAWLRAAQQQADQPDKPLPLAAESPWRTNRLN